MSDFRLRLKTETAAAHDRVDAGYGALDISIREDYATFLHGQFLGHYLTKQRYVAGAAFPALSDRIAAISQDLRILGKQVSLPKNGVPTNSAAFHPLGLTYVIAGSLHGTNVLKKIWAGSTDQTVQKARNFINFSGLNPEWVKTVNTLKTQTFAVEEELQIIRSVNHAFDLFETGLLLAKNDKET